MKRNLFVLHTQYNLILSVGLVKTEFLGCHNDLILFSDFKLTEVLKNKIENNFDSVIYLSGSYPKLNEKYVKKIPRYITIKKKIKRFMLEKYDEIFLVDDVCIPEMYIMKLAYAQNDGVNYSWLEDGTSAYFSNNVAAGGLSKNSFLKSIRKIIFKYLLVLKEFYHFDSCLGTHPLIKTIYVTFPSYVREELKHKKKQEINKSSFDVGLKNIFPAYSREMPAKSAMIILDMLSVYKDLDIVRDYLVDLGAELIRLGYNLFYKYHPREPQVLSELNKKWQEIDKSIAIESVYASIKHNEIIVLGIKSTGLQTAKKLGYKTFSLIKMMENSTSSAILNFYEDIEIILPTSFDSLLQDVKN